MNPSSKKTAQNKMVVVFLESMVVRVWSKTKMRALRRCIFDGTQSCHRFIVHSAFHSGQLLSNKERTSNKSTLFTSASWFKS